MSLSISLTTWWWIACIALVGAELVTGTFYLLMAALGLAAAALLSYTDATLTQQVATAAVVSGGAVAIWHFIRARTRPASDPVLADVGQTVHVSAWREDGTATVQYRGAPWTAVMAQADAPTAPGPHHIVSVDGPRLRIAPGAHAST